MKQQWLKKLSWKVISLLTYIFNATLRLFYIYKQWKFPAALTVLKPDKDGTKPTSYRSVILLSTTAKLFEKLVLFRISKKIYRKNNNILQHQYGLIKRLSIDRSERLSDNKPSSENIRRQQISFRRRREITGNGHRLCPVRRRNASRIHFSVRHARCQTYSSDQIKYRSFKKILLIRPGREIINSHAPIFAIIYISCNISC